MRADLHRDELVARLAREQPRIGGAQLDDHALAVGTRERIFVVDDRGQRGGDRVRRVVEVRDAQAVRRREPRYGRVHERRVDDDGEPVHATLGDLRVDVVGLEARDHAIARVRRQRAVRAEVVELDVVRAERRATRRRERDDARAHARDRCRPGRPHQPPAIGARR